MKNYTLQTKLLFEYYGSEQPNVTERRKYKFDDFQFCDAQTQIKVKIQQDFVVFFEDVICNSFDEALLILNKILPNICESLSIMIQIEAGENRKYQPNLSYNISDVKIVQISEISSVTVREGNEEKQIYVAEGFGIHEEITCIVTNKLSFEYYQLLYDLSTEHEAQYFKDTIYRAIRCRDAQSKYFTLFTMVEYIETKYKDFAKASNILNENEISCLLKSLEGIMSDRESSINKQLSNRIKDLLGKATLESRSQKLSKIISEKYSIETISKALINYNITPDKMNEFIIQRNSLFHGTIVSAEKINHLVQLCNELLFLCLEILKRFS